MPIILRYIVYQQLHSINQNTYRFRISSMWGTLFTNVIYYFTNLGLFYVFSKFYYVDPSDMYPCSEAVESIILEYHGQQSNTHPTHFFTPFRNSWLCVVFAKHVPQKNVLKVEHLEYYPTYAAERALALIIMHCEAQPPRISKLNYLQVKIICLEWHRLFWKSL